MRAGVVPDTMITDELCAWLRLFFLSGEINKIRNEFQNKANIGYAYIDFVYDSVVYKLEPAAIAATKDMFHHIAEMIQKDLKHIGCPDTHYQCEME